MTQPNEMLIPLDCFAGIGEVWKGDYGCQAIKISGNPSVVDIGANIGAFAMWAIYYMKASSVICYEPNPTIFTYLKRNLEVIASTWKEVHLDANEMAVGNPSENILIQNDRSRMQSSQHEIAGQVQKRYEIRVLEPENIPPCNVLKMDCEGAEGYICERLNFIPDYLVLESHEDDNYKRVINALYGKMKLVESVVDCGNRTALLKFIRA